MSDPNNSNEHGKIVAFATFSAPIASLMGAVFVTDNPAKRALITSTGFVLSLLIWRLRFYLNTWNRSHIEALLVGIAVASTATLVPIILVDDKPTPPKDPSPPGTTTTSPVATKPASTISFTNISDGSTVRYFEKIEGIGFPESATQLWVYGIDKYNLHYSLRRVVSKSGAEPEDTDRWEACVQIGTDKSGAGDLTLLLTGVPIDLINEIPNHTKLEKLPSRLQVFEVVRVRREEGATRAC